jgi:hypothetical protein
MAYFDEASVTAAGAAILSQWAGGGTLVIDGATAGSGTAADISALTALTSEKQEISIARYTVDAAAGSVTYVLQFAAADTEYTATQIGIWGHVGTGRRTLICVYQDARGILIPAASDIPDFVYEFAASIATGIDGQISVNVDTSAVATQAQLNEAADALGMKTFAISIPVSAWSATPNGTYMYVLSGDGITADMQVFFNGGDSYINVADLAYACEAGLIYLTTSTVPTGTLTGTLAAIRTNSAEAMNGILKKRPAIVKESLLMVTAQTSGGQTILNSHRISDYDFILFRWTTGTGSSIWTRDTRLAIVEESGRFGASELSFVDSNNVQRWASAEYVDDTHVSTGWSANATGILYAYGIRLVC